MIRKRESLYYGDYLKIDDLTSLQVTESSKVGNDAHDETLFIIVHQVYELWFKQILHEINSICAYLSTDKLKDQDLAVCNDRLKRIVEIQHILLQQLQVMETMKPMDFLEFRDLLTPASGFQSVQFRQVELLLGFKLDSSMKGPVLGRLSENDQKIITETSNKTSLFDLVEKWLIRMPYCHNSQYDFWQEYSKSVQKMLAKDKQIISDNHLLSAEEIKFELSNLTLTSQSFEVLFDSEKYESQSKRRLGQNAMLNALFIFIYREQPKLAQAFNFLNSLIELDANFTTWRHRHALMAHRMLGSKIGTGGSSGHEYLKRSAEKRQIFTDLYDISSFLIPRSCLPEFPETLEN
ncbi:MAG: tryptophan 2,3-dioxygenase [Lentisphaerales bacterium]|nr:tryptophan 2,3-dioxygenase [Lentisphaerales bacterium]